jgi:quercetin dioxygenase-like cupin family protein
LLNILISQPEDRMKVNHFQDVEQKPVEMAGSEGCSVRWLVGKTDGAENFSMRQFEVAVGGFTPCHSHDYEHEVYVLEGQGTVLENETLHDIKSGDVLLVCPNEIHQFKNTGVSPLKFLCLIPNSAMEKPIHQAPECGVEN